MSLLSPLSVPVQLVPITVHNQQLEEQGIRDRGRRLGPTRITMFGIETQGGQSGGQKAGLHLTQQRERERKQETRERGLTNMSLCHTVI